MKIAFPLRSKIVVALGVVIVVTLLVFAWAMDAVVVMPRIREQVGVSLSTMATQAQASLTRRLLERALASREPALHMALAQISAVPPDTSPPLDPERAALADHHPLRDGTELLLLNREGTVIDGPSALLGSAVAFGGGMPDDRFFQLVNIGGREFDVGRAAGQRTPDLEGLGWSVVAVQPLDFAARPLVWMSAGTAGFTALAGLVLFSSGWVIATRVTRPLTAIRLAASRLAAGDDRAPVPSFSDYAEVQSISRSLQTLDLRMREGERQSVRIGRSLHQRESLLRAIAHDLRSPLTAAMSLSETLANPRSRLSGEDRAAAAAGCFAAMRNMQDLLDNLLRWAFLQMDVSTASGPAELRQTIHDALTLSFATAEAKGVDLIVYAPPLEVDTEAEAIGTVVRNLVNNAIKFTRPGGTVRVVADTCERDLVVSVADDGIGMSADTLQSLFPAQYPPLDGEAGRLPRSTPGTEGEPGTGLGLILCRELVERCGGWIGAESVEGFGTTFRFSLPVG